MKAKSEAIAVKAKSGDGGETKKHIQNETQRKMKEECEPVIVPDPAILGLFVKLFRARQVLAIEGNCQSKWRREQKVAVTMPRKQLQEAGVSTVG
jgi:hypothetical protein